MTGTVVSVCVLENVMHSNSYGFICTKAITKGRQICDLPRRADGHKCLFLLRNGPWMNSKCSTQNDNLFL